MKTKTHLVLLAVLYFTTAFSQNEVSTVYWGTTIFDFRVSPFQILSTSVADSHECAASICDEDGNLLFYSNGGECPGLPGISGIWGANGQYLQNGQFLDSMGCRSSSQGAIVLPDPAGITASSKKYYLLTKDCFEALLPTMNPDPNLYSSGFSYAVIDMLANNGSGAVVSKNHVVVPHMPGTNPDFEPITAVPDTYTGSATGYWIYSFSVDSLYKIHFGVNGFDSFEKLFSTGGKLTVSPDRRHLLVKGSMYALDLQTGSLQLVHAFNTYSEGAFSADGRKVYIIENSILNQYDLDQPNWQTNPTELGTFALDEYYFSMCLVPSGSIFIFNIFDPNYIDAVINCPNTSGINCGFDSTNVSIQGGTLGICSPNIPAHFLYNTQSNCELGLSEPEVTPISLVPNPSNGNFTVHFGNSNEHDLTMRIHDLTGRTLRMIPVSGSNTGQVAVQADDLPQGEYFLEVSSDGKPFRVERLVVQDAF